MIITPKVDLQLCKTADGSLKEKDIFKDGLINIDINTKTTYKKIKNDSPRELLSFSFTPDELPIGM